MPEKRISVGERGGTGKVNDPSSSYYGKKSEVNGSGPSRLVNGTGSVAYLNNKRYDCFVKGSSIRRALRFVDNIRRPQRNRHSNPRHPRLKGTGKTMTVERPNGCLKKVLHELA